MEFRTWLNEASLVGLYDSAVKAYPKTTMRQHALHPVKIVHVHWTPHSHFKTLYVRGLAQSEGHEYSPTILFKKVQFHSHSNAELIGITASNGNEYYLERLTLQETPVQVRCNCGDFRFRFRYYNFLDHSLFGPKGQKYESKELRGPINPTESPGVCKHIIKLMQVLHQSHLLR